MTSTDRSRRLRALVKRPAYRLAETAWYAVFRLAGLLLRPKVVPVVFSGRDSVVVVAAHPDDEMLGCARALALHATAGDRVVVVAVTDGRASRALGLSPDEMASRRALEFRAAMRELGVEARPLGLPEGGWSDDELRGRLRTLLAEIEPTIVYAPSVVDYHAEHRAVAQSLAGSFPEAHRVAEVRVYQIHVPLTPVLANLGVATSAPTIQDSVARAESAYVTQAPNLIRGRRLVDQARALWRAGAPIEVFWTLPATIYARVMSTVATGSYRGLRDRPFADGLAWLVGLRDRRRLAQNARVIQRSDTTYRSAS